MQLFLSHVDVDIFSIALQDFDFLLPSTVVFSFWRHGLFLSLSPEVGMGLVFVRCSLFSKIVLSPYTGMIVFPFGEDLATFLFQQKTIRQYSL